MKTTDNAHCSGCKISMFCKKEHNTEGSCNTSLKAVAMAFVVPLIGIVLLICTMQGKIDEGLIALSVILFLILYFVLLKWLLRYIRF